MSLLINQHETQFTDKSDTIYIDGNQIIRQVIFNKFLTSQEQADIVIEKIIVNNGFFPNFKKDYVEFTNSLNSQTKYFYYPNTLEIEKVDEKVIDYV